MKKRLISTALALCMVLAMMPVGFAAQLPAPTGLKWATETTDIKITDFTDPDQEIHTTLYPGDLMFDWVENGSNEYEITYYRDGEEVERATHHWGADVMMSPLTLEDFRYLPRESGTYTFSVRAVGDGNEIEDSEVAISPEWVYTAPEAQLGTATGLRWDGATACWDHPEGSREWTITWYYSETEDGEYEALGATSGYDFVDGNSMELENWALEEGGEGYYKFTIRALSYDITKIRPGEESEMSPAYHTSQASGNIESTLDEILGSLGETPNEAAVAAAVEEVKKLDTDDLRVAMAADQENDGVTAQIQALEEKTGVNVASSVEDGLGMEESQITITGAVLNAAKNTNKVTFQVSKPEKEAVVPGVYEDTIQFDFQLKGAEEPTGKLAVPIKITMPIPENITPENLRILHYSAEGEIEEIILPYIHLKDDVWYATFVVTHFSTFVFAESKGAAAIDETPYDTLQEAVDAVENDGTITLLADCDETVTISREVRFTLDKGEYAFTGKIQAGTGYHITEKDGVYTVEKDTTPVEDNDDDSSSSGSSTTYTAKVNKTGSGSAAVSPQNAKKGDKVTVTAIPNAGYEVAAVTVTDSSGKTVAVSNEGNGKYTFTQPASRVTVQVTFRAVEEQPDDTAMPFTDVAAGQWYAEAVQYVYEKGLMTGTSATAFAPDATTTRGMIVTMLYRLEGEPAAAASGFADVEAGQWYANAVNWAAANQIVNGYGETFGPNDIITREQMAAILYRYAQYKGYDVSASGEMNAYTDAANVSDYASSAMQWAVGEGLLNGVTETTLAPDGSAIRAQVAAIFMRFCENVAK
ncbi:MAG TPA: S-layer homology domain-containing protein [Firmicutes bacterium]|nr:S-layer homology domain-containing protein [Bacillota bacterium]